MKKLEFIKSEASSKMMATTLQFFLFCVLSVFTVISFAAPQPSPEQIEAFKKLPRQQQELVAKQYGIDLSVLQGGGAKAAPSLVNVPVVIRSEPDVVQGSKNAESAAKEATNEKTQADSKIRAIAGDDLKLFGYDLFSGVPTTFAPATEVPIPSEYIVGPGDSIKLHLYGKLNSQYELTVDRDGKVTIPEIGPLYVAGVSFAELKNLISNELKQRAIGLNVITTLGELRSIRIFILGEATRPGSYTVSGLSSITNALFVSGGVSKRGSLRNIQLKRNGKIIQKFDLYDLLIRGDTSNDVRLLPGDVLFVPPIGKTVGIDGDVKRPAIYELKAEESVGDILNLSGGYLPTAYLESSKINRINDKGIRTVVDLDLRIDADQTKKVKNGDVIQVFSILDDLQDIITLEGHVGRPGVYAYRAGMTIKDLIGEAADLLPNPDLDFALIKREHRITREISFHQFSLRNVINRSQVNIGLTKRDTIYIFGNEGLRSEVLAKDVEQLKQQSGQANPPKIVTVIGEVEIPGTYPLVEGMTVRDILSAGHQAKIGADLSYAVLKRINTYRDVEIKTIALNRLEGLDLRLAAEDQLYVFERGQDRSKMLEPLMQELRRQTTKAVENIQVSASGQVRFPGSYPYSEAMTIPDLIAAGGGLTESAYLGATEIQRTKSDKMFEIAYESIQVNLSNQLGDPTFVLKPGDVVNVRRIPEWEDQRFVEIKGEFVFPGRYSIKNGDSIIDLMKRVGGLTDEAFLGGAVFLRDSVAKRQVAQIERLKKQVNKQLTMAMTSQTLSGNGSAKISELGDLSVVVDSIDETGLGRVSVDLKAMLRGKADPLLLSDGDTIYLPKTPSTVVVVGEVQIFSAHAYRGEMSYKDYIELSGGITRFADSEKIYIVRADGRVVTPNSNWIKFSDAKIRRGDTIVVPVDARLKDNLTLWQQATQILYNTAVAVAAIAAL